MSRFGAVPIINTRIGLLADNLIEVSKRLSALHLPADSSRDYGSKPTSTADKL